MHEKLYHLTTRTESHYTVHWRFRLSKEIIPKFIPIGVAALDQVISIGPY